ncbi:hypothetical protein DASC09_005430 [Saccharomycopsis crataegensis]|uniref:Uncharacterized protein n=1 Tax=Saccharomycopsis crataegensis TaxID=43959 RepID=A0AAV5QEP0_9ASCO|nr:hypothetical protein DASC09_005430 [Saccharomycopsis crataegensis]
MFFSAERSSACHHEFQFCKPSPREVPSNPSPSLDPRQCNAFVERIVRKNGFKYPRTEPFENKDIFLTVSQMISVVLNYYVVENPAEKIQ